MRAVVTTDRAVMELLDLPEPGEPGPGEVIVRPQAVGICGSDFHYFLGEIGDQAQFRASRVTRWGLSWSRSGPTARAGCRPATRGAAPSATAASATRAGSGARTCATTSLIGIHSDGGFQEQLRMPEELVSRPANRARRSRRWPSRCRSLRAINRARLEAGEHAVIFGAGPIGQAICLLARERAPRC